MKAVAYKENLPNDKENALQNIRLDDESIVSGRDVLLEPTVVLIVPASIILAVPLPFCRCSSLSNFIINLID